MIQVYTYTLTPPEGSDIREVAVVLDTIMERMAARSEHLVKVEVDAQVSPESALLLRVWFEAPDRWYIQKRIKFPVIAALRKAGMGQASIRAVQVETPADGRTQRTPRKAPPGRWGPQDWYLEGEVTPESQGAL